MEDDKIIGRHAQLEELHKIAETDSSEFVAIYGRRRVGKTFLVRKAFENTFSFFVTGVHGADKKTQLANFAIALQRYSKSEQLLICDSWILAFYELSKYLEKLPEGKKIVFFDELPWMDSHKSGLIQALENFWNGWAAFRNDIKLIVCGSATSWIINKIIRNRGGLHNRVKHKIVVEPFHLKECEEYFNYYKFGYSKKQIAEAYMVMGGIPYYLSLMNRNMSLPQNIDILFFQNNAKLQNEFNELYRSLFLHSNPYITIVECLAKKGVGLTRRELINSSGLADNGKLSTMLEELELCGFIRKYLPFRSNKERRLKGKRSSTDCLYQLIDFYTIFYFKFLKDKITGQPDFWVMSSGKPLINNWKGISFEQLCLYHVAEIKKALGISGILSNVCSWHSEESNPGAQIDLIIDRVDDAINICEMKYSEFVFKIDKKYYQSLENKMEVFKEETQCTKAMLLTLVTTQGLKDNDYSKIIMSTVVLDQLFE